MVRHRICRNLLSSQTFTVKGMSSSVDSAFAQSYRGYRNRLGLEKSPYLLQHASNPVDWFAWGDEAFQKARAENKLIFLSVGYSTCHWCHVMERESFENEEVGRLLNEDFVSIKVDREERPDVDRIYMAFVQATSGGGGWPMSVWLTPDLKPIVGGTYFPPDDRYFGRPGFKSILKKISAAWRESPNAVMAQSTAILDALSEATKKTEGSADSAFPNCTAAVDKCFRSLSASYDQKMGGFGRFPKFPQPVNLNFLMHVYENCCREANLNSSSLSEQGQRALQMTLHTLRMMARGGMHDHVGKGFHRYSTDEEWHVPHFEKMLYDQAQLAVINLDAFQATKEELFADIARDILAYVNRDMSDKSGGFYSAEDADSLPAVGASEKREGAFCVWTFEEVNEVLPGSLDGCNIKLADVFCFHYDVRPEGNVHIYKDPHGELTNKNVLIERSNIEQTAERFSLTVQLTKDALSAGIQKLWERRQQRPRPHLDNKMIAAWNGMMISAFARAGQVLGDSSYIQRAVDAIKFVQRNLLAVDDGQQRSSSADGRLLRSCYVDSETKEVVQSHPAVLGFADDYAFMVRAALDVYEACHDESWLQWAIVLQKTQDELFWDNQNFGYYSSMSDDKSIVLRLKEDQDGAEPSYNSVSAHNLLRLGSIIDSESYRRRAEQVFRAFANRLETLPMAVPELLTALMLYSAPWQQICICGRVASDDTQAMLKCVHSHYLPRKTVLVLDGSEQQPENGSNTQDSSLLQDRLRSLEKFVQIDGRTTAYVCDNFTCSLPISSINDLDTLLDYRRSIIGSDR